LSSLGDQVSCRVFVDRCQLLAGERGEAFQDSDLGELIVVSVGGVELAGEAQDLGLDVGRGIQPRGARSVPRSSRREAASRHPCIKYGAGFSR